MPKQIDYPRAPLDRALQLAEAIDSLGGSASVQTAADKLGKKVGGAFRDMVSGARQFGLVDVEKDQLSVTELYRRFKLAYTDAERQDVLRGIALYPPLFAELHERFVGRAIPDFLDRMLIREHGVNDSVASRVHKYFEDAIQHAGLTDGDGSLIPVYDEPASTEAEEENVSGSGGVDSNAPTGLGLGTTQHKTTSEYTVTFTGPGLNTTLVLQDTDDFGIVDAVLKKVKAEIKQATKSTGNSATAEENARTEEGDTQE